MWCWFTYSVDHCYLSTFRFGLCIISDFFFVKLDICCMSIQIPFCVVVGWMMGQKMDLNFQLFETATLFITVLVVAFMLQVSS